jgi:phospholipid/cholesterol/gamma-HCH transport system substrate-binding protein
MKINNETKIGVMAVMGIVLLALGFNFLKGKNLFKKENHIYAVYQDIQSLQKSNPVLINGLQVGTVANFEAGPDMKRIIVTINLTRNVDIPDNSIALINPPLLGSASMEIQLGSSTKYLKNNDTVITILSGGAFDQALKVINPVLYEVKNSVKSLDSVLHVVTGVFDPATKNNIKGIVANLNTTTASFALSAASLEKILNVENGALASSLNNVKNFTANLNSNNERFDSILENTKIASAKFAAIDLKKTLDTLNIAVENFKKGSEKINSKDGSLGLLLNDTKLYDNLQSTANKLNILLDDLRVHPKRYLNVSVFGKKDKGEYLTVPLVDTLKRAKK